MKSIIEPIIEEYELGQKNNELKDPLIFLFENLANNETYKRIFCFKVTSIDEKRYSNDRIARCLTIENYLIVQILPPLGMLQKSKKL